MLLAIDFCPARNDIARFAYSVSAMRRRCYGRLVYLFRRPQRRRDRKEATLTDAGGPPDAGIRTDYNQFFSAISTVSAAFQVNIPAARSTRATLRGTAAGRRSEFRLLDGEHSFSHSKKAGRTSFTKQDDWLPWGSAQPGNGTKAW